MIKFILFCMAVVALALAAIAFEGPLSAINAQHEALIARDTPPPQTPQEAQDTPSFEAIYAGATAQAAEEQAAMQSPESLNELAPAAGEIPQSEADDAFGGGFGQTAPRALEEDQGVLEQPAPTP